MLRRHRGRVHDRCIAEFSATTRGVVALRDAPAVGMTAEGLRAHLRRRGWDSPYPSIWVAPGVPATFEQAALVALLAAGPTRVALARHAAAYAWRMTAAMPTSLDVIASVARSAPAVGQLRLPVAQGTRQVALPVRVVRSRTLRTGHVVSLGAVTVTTPARTIIDLAAVMPLDDVRILVIDARQRRLLTLRELEELHLALSTYQGRPKVTRILRDLHEETCDSALEWDFRVDARRRGFRPFPKPFPFRCPDGVTIEVDVAFPQEWVAVECHGLGGHSNRADLVTQNLRQNMAVAGGWRPFVVDWTRLKKAPDRLFSELAVLLRTPHPHAAPAPIARRR
jgi:hypothetical protein